MHILVLQHEEIEHLGVFKAFLEQDGATWQVVELDKGEPIPALDSFNGMIVMGGPQDVWQEDRYPWLCDEKAGPPLRGGHAAPVFRHLPRPSASRRCARGERAAGKIS